MNINAFSILGILVQLHTKDPTATTNRNEVWRKLNTEEHKEKCSRRIVTMIELGLIDEFNPEPGAPIKSGFPIRISKRGLEFFRECSICGLVEQLDDD